MNRRAAIANALAFLTVTILPARADPTFIINDWTKGRNVPQFVRRSEIQECIFVNIKGSDPGYDWVEIITRDGRRVTSELSRSQDVAGLLRQLADAGVPINDHDRPRQLIAGGGYGYVRDNGKIDRVKFA